jgi:hypothetical protein
MKMMLGHIPTAAAPVPARTRGKGKHVLKSLQSIHSADDSPSISGRDFNPNVAVQRRALLLCTLLGVVSSTPHVARAQSQLTPEALQAFKDALSIRGSDEVR